MAKTVNQRQQALKARRKAKGLKEVRNLWVPVGREPEIKSIAEKMRGETES